MSTKVLIYAHTFAPKVGGLETVVFSLAKGLARANKSVGDVLSAVTLATPTARDGFDDGSLPYAVVRQPSWSQLVTLIRDADVIHVAGPCFVPLLLGLVFQKRIVVEHHGFQSVCPNGQLFHEPTQMPCPGYFMAGRRLECWRCNAKDGTFQSVKMALQTVLRRWLCERVAANVTPTNWLAEVLQLPRMTTIYHGIVTNTAPKEVPAGAAPTTFGFIGRLVSTKGVHILLQAAEQLASRGYEFQLQIIGDGPQRAKLMHQAKALGLSDRVQFLGQVAEAELDRVVSGWAVVVMPSLGGEVFGMVAAESMLRGKPLIVSDLGALVEVIGETGQSFPSGDATALAKCLERILLSPDGAVFQGQEAQKRARLHFAEDAMIKEHLAVYERVLKDEEGAC